MNNKPSASARYIPEWDYFDFTSHAEWRMAQRNLSYRDLRFVLQYGEQSHRAGAVFICLRRCDIPNDKHICKQFARLEGTTVVMSRDEQGLIVTAYRNRQAGPRRIKQKRRNTGRPKQWPYWYH